MKEKKKAIYLLIEQDLDDAKILYLLKYAKRLSKSLFIHLKIILIYDDSLAHYGEVDQLASFDAKEQFVNYVNEIAQSECKKILKLSLMVLSQYENWDFVCISKENLKTFFEKGYTKIEFVMLLAKRKFGVFSEKILIPFDDVLKKFDVNILLINNLVY